MQRITKFKADDGAEFDTEAKCIEYEALAAEVAEVVSILPARPDDDGCQFSNGSGYLQHDAAQLKKARDALLRIGMRYMTNPPWFQQTRDGEAHPSWAGRLMDECPRPLSRAWYRFQCCDIQGREWGQPYYANHPDEATQTRLN